MKKNLLIFICIFLCFSLFAAPSKEEIENQTVLFTDSCGRKVEIPKEITRVASSGAVTTMFFSSLAPEYLVAIHSPLSESQKTYFSREMQNLPVTGQLYGSKANINLEAILSTDAQILIDIGEYKQGIEEDLDIMQKQIGIPCIFIESNLGNMAQAFRTLGGLLKGKEERAEEIAAYIEETLDLARENRGKIHKEERLTVMYTGAPDGLGTNPKGSTQAQVLEIIGADNAIIVENVKARGNSNTIDMEMLYNFDPDVIVFSPDSYYDNVASDSTWNILSAVKNNRYYEIPDTPYNWMSNPPSMNMILGIWWLGNIVYPQYYNYDLSKEIKRAFSVFWNYNLTDGQVKDLLKIE